MDTYSTVKTGELAGSTSAVQCPDVDGSLVMFIAANDNAGKVYIGGAGVTKADGTTDTTTGIPLAAGDATPWFPVDGLSSFYRISDNVGDECFYVVLTN